MLIVVAGVLLVGGFQVVAEANGVDRDDAGVEAAGPVTRSAATASRSLVARVPTAPGLHKPAERTPSPPPELCVGAAAMARRGCPPSTSVFPSGKAAVADFGPAYDQGCVTPWPWEPSEYRRCEYFGGAHNRKNPNLALVGNSHAIHYLPAILSLAAKNHWKVTTYFANKCFPTTVPLELSERETANCLAWGKWVLADTKAAGYDLVVTSNREGAAPLGVSRSKGYPVWKKGYARYVREWLDAGTRVLVIRDNPYPGHTNTFVPDCVARHQNDFRACSAPRDAWLKPDPLADAAKGAHSPRAQVADLTAMFCTSRCLPVIGNVLVYRDRSHLTATYSRTLAPYLAPYVRRSLAAR
jgi:hypothetical protein